MMVAGAVMMTAVSRCWISTSGDLHVGRHHRAGNVRHAAGHDGEQLGLGHAGDERLDGQRRFGLAHENAGGHVERLGAAGAHDLLHHHAPCPCTTHCITPR